jgi:hypothetical protein
MKTAAELRKLTDEASSLSHVTIPSQAVSPPAGPAVALSTTL